MHKSLDLFEFRPDPTTEGSQGELIGWDSSRRLCVRSSVRPQYTFNHEYLLDRQANRKYILYEASLGQGKGCISFGADQIRTHDPVDNKTYLNPSTMTFSYAQLIIAGTT